MVILQADGEAPEQFTVPTTAKPFPLSEHTGGLTR